MPNVTLVFFLLLIPLSGFIAWAGDRIGHKSGKKRHSLFGLRPRHTAMVFTIGSGMLTALVSFGLFYLFSETFRIVVRDGAEMYGTNRRLKMENRLQSDELRRSQQSVRDVQTRIENSKKELQAAEAERVKAVAAYEEAEAKRKTAESLAASAQKKYASAQTDLQIAQQTLGKAQTDLGRVRGDLGRKTTQVARADTRREQAEARVRRAEKEVTAAAHRVILAHTEQQTAQAEVKKIQGKIVAFRNMNITLFKQATSLSKSAGELQKQLVANKAEYDDLTDRTKQLRDQFATLEGEKVKAQNDVRLLRESATALRSGQITYQVGEEVDRLAIPPGHSVWRIKVILTAFLNSASREAERRGAARGENERSVVILPRPYAGGGEPVSDRARTPREIKLYTEESAISDAAELIRRANEDTVIVASAATNAVAGETVPVTFHVYRNPVVLKTDMKLGELSVNGDGSRQEITDRLHTFLNRDIHRKLIATGIIPRLRGEDIPGGDTTRVTEQFELSGDEWLSLMDNVRRAGPKAKVLVYPARDLRAADTPSLRFDVKHPLIQAPAFLRDIK